MQKNENIHKLFKYSGCSNLFFERSIFIIYLAYKGLSISEIAIFQAVINIAMVISEVPTGIFADKFGKKASLLIGNTLMIFYYLFMLFSTNFLAFVFGAFIFGIGSTFTSGTDEAFLYDLIDDINQSVKYFGQLSAIITASVAFAMVVGGFVQKYSWDLVMILGICAQFIGILFILKLPNNLSKLSENNNNKGTLATALKEIKSNDFILNILIILGFSVGVSSATYILAQDLLSRHMMTPSQISVLFLINSIICVLVFGKVENIIKKCGKFSSLLISSILLLIAFILINSNNIYIICTMIIAISVLNNYCVTILLNDFNNTVDDTVRATLISFFNMTAALFMSFIFIITSMFQGHYMAVLTMLGIISTVMLTLLIIKYYRNVSSL